MINYLENQEFMTFEKICDTYLDSRILCDYCINTDLYKPLVLLKDETFEEYKQIYQYMSKFYCNLRVLCGRDWLIYYNRISYASLSKDNIEIPINMINDTYNKKVFKSKIDWKHTKVDFYIKIGVTSRDNLLLGNIPFLFVFNDITCMSYDILNTYFNYSMNDIDFTKPLNLVYNKNNSTKLLFPIIIKKICLGKFEFNNYRVYTCFQLSPRDKSKHYIFNNIDLFSVNIITLLQEYINLCKKSHKKFNILNYFYVEPVPIENTFGANIDQHHIKFLVNKRCSLSELLRYICRKGTKLREDTVLTININETALKLHNKSAEENSDIFTINYIE